MHEFEMLENALLEALAPLKESGVRTLAPFVGRIKDAAERTRRAGRFPSVHVSVRALTISARNRVDAKKLEAAVIAADQSVRGREDAARGDSESPGAYRLLEEIRGLLHRRTLVSDWAPAACVFEGPLEAAPDEDACIYLARYELRTPQYKD